MQQDQIDLLVSNIDTLSEKACRKMTPSERHKFFTYQENRIASSSSLKKKYDAPVRTYYKGRKKGKEKEVYEVDGPVFEKLWKHLVMYATKAAMYSHKVYNFQDFEVQNDVADIKYQTFFVLRFWGPTPTGQKFSSFFKLIVNNILTTSARRRGVYKEEIDFTYWFDSNKYDQKYWDAYQEKIKTMKRYPMFIDFMYTRFLDLYFKKDKEAILKARREHARLNDGTHFIWNSKNCKRTMTSYKTSSIFTPIGGDNGEGSERILLDVLAIPSDHLSEEFHLDLSQLHISTDLHKSIEIILSGESLTAAAKAANMTPSHLRDTLKKVVVNLVVA